MIHCPQCQSQVEGTHVPGCAAEPRTDQLTRLIAHELIVLDQARDQIRFSQERIARWRSEYDAIRASESVT